MAKCQICHKENDTYLVWNFGRKLCYPCSSKITTLVDAKNIERDSPEYLKYLDDPDVKKYLS